MGQHLKTFVLLILIIGFCSSCVIKAPDANSDLGSPTKADDFYAAVDAAQDVPQEKVFHVGDTGVIQNYNSVLGSISINSSLQESIDQITPEYFLGTITDMESGTSKQFQIARKSSQTPTAFKKIKAIFHKVAAFFKKIEIVKSAAVANIPVVKTLQERFSAISPKVKDVEESAGGPCLNGTGDDPYTAQCYGLSVLNHKYTTSNCSEIPNCTVNSTQISVNEVRNYSDGKVMKIRWTFEISKEVPGLFIILDACLSTVIVDGDNQVPLTRCDHVKSFKFGN